MYESPLKPKYVVTVEFEPVAAHYYGIAGLDPLYLTPQDGVNTDPSKARTHTTESIAIQSGEKAKKTFWGIRAFRVEQIDLQTNDGPH